MDFNIYNSIILAGIVQGFIFALVVLCSKKYRAPGTITLALFILSFSLDNFQYYLEDTGLISSWQLTAIIYFPFQFLSGPLFLLYGLTVLEPERKVTRKDAWLFTLFALALLLTSVQKWFLLTNSRSPNIPYSEIIESSLEYLSLAQDLAILIFLFIKVRRFEAHSKIHLQLAWFKFVIFALFTLSSIWLLIMVADYVFNVEYWYALYIGMAVIVYWMGHIGIYKYGIEQERKKLRSYSIQNHSTFAASKQKNEHIKSLEKFLVDERNFLNPVLSLDDAASALNLSKSHLSRIINAELEMGFPDYLNSLRVEEAKSYLTNPEFANYTLVAIGLEAGFNSKTTFNTAFKKLTSQTPSQYRQSCKNSRFFVKSQ